MVYSDEILAIVPARSGSKSVPHKNIKMFAGKPLMAHSINQALESGIVSRVLLSTDSEEYARIGREFGAYVPFLRPASISGDNSTDLECFIHALEWLLKNEGKVPKLLIHLRPTCPNRKPSDIVKAVRLLENNPQWESIRSVVPSPDTPFKMWYRCDDGELKPVVESSIKEAHSSPRQFLPPTYLPNGNVDVIRTRTILEKGLIAGSCVGSMLMSELHDIDTHEQFAEAEQSFIWANGIPSNKTFVFDIDGVIASIVPTIDYALAGPITENISRVNRLYDAGNKIILFTARGTVTGINWSDITKKQMAEWGVKYHQLLFGKPASDYYIDDKMISLDTLAQLDKVI
ncbi:acylneuraminate cytidylyltransferase [bacterium]|nr:acylneuraminate cytidylyltransferase [Opitutae bacterium]NBY41983.1 acylneuraminate cytidylyltransferase [Verrucomicrobiota bacterium]NDD70827.1 acylneuraminate cytidylyltransferase [bacterium]